MVTDDPTVTNPDLYAVLWENEHVRVLEYLDEPGAVATPHDHPNSVMVTLSDFRRRLSLGERTLEVELSSGQAVWLPAQRHAGENIGDTATHTILIELKGDAAGSPDPGVLGPPEAKRL
jgi:quercetin dioxygenase-like cupin family protein